jgi:hypothetical protein
MRRGTATALTLLITLPMLAAVPSSSAAQTGKKNPGQKVVKAFGSAESAGAIATATATCPKAERPDQRPRRAISGGFQMKGVVPVFTTQGNPRLPPSGSGVVYESRKVGQRSWRVSAQSLWGTFTLKVFVYCQSEVPKTTHASTTVATPGTSQIGPATAARCRSGKAVAGGFSTPPPFTATGAANTVIGSLPSGKTGWEAQVLSSQASSLTSYVYCAKRKRVLLRHSTTPAASDVLVYANIYDASCPVGTFTGGGGFSEEGLTTSRYLIPVESHKLSGWASWHANALIVGSGVPVTLSAHAVCA